MFWKYTVTLLVLKIRTVSICFCRFSWNRQSGCLGQQFRSKCSACFNGETKFNIWLQHDLDAVITWTSTRVSKREQKFVISKFMKSTDSQGSLEVSMLLVRSHKVYKSGVIRSSIGAHEQNILWNSHGIKMIHTNVIAEVNLCLW